MAQSLKYLGMIYTQQKLVEEAIDNFDKSLNIYEQIYQQDPNNNNIIAILINIADLYVIKKMPKMVLNYLIKALIIIPQEHIFKEKILKKIEASLSLFISSEKKINEVSADILKRAKYLPKDKIEEYVNSMEEYIIENQKAEDNKLKQILEVASQMNKASQLADLIANDPKITEILLEWKLEEVESILNVLFHDSQDLSILGVVNSVKSMLINLDMIDAVGFNKIIFYALSYGGYFNKIAQQGLQAIETIKTKLEYFLDIGDIYNVAISFGYLEDIFTNLDNSGRNLGFLFPRFDKGPDDEYPNPWGGDGGGMFYYGDGLPINNGVSECPILGKTNITNW